MGQSSNDVIPSTIHIAADRSIQGDLVPSLSLLHTELSRKALEFKDVIKIGAEPISRMRLPMRLGQEFSGYARQIELGIQRIASTEIRLSELALGGTAVGSGPECTPGICLACHWVCYRMPPDSHSGKLRITLKRKRLRIPLSKSAAP